MTVGTRGICFLFELTGVRFFLPVDVDQIDDPNERNQAIKLLDWSESVTKFVVPVLGASFIVFFIISLFDSSGARRRRIIKRGNVGQSACTFG